MSKLQHRGRFASWTTIDAANDASEGLVPLAQLENLRRDDLRTDAEEFKQLCTSIKERGLISEIQVRRVKGGYRIVAGRHRAAAHAELGFDAVPAAVVDVDDEAEALQMLEENLLRTDLDPWHEAVAFQEAMERGGLKQGELAKRIGKSQPTISKRLAMLKAPACIGQLAPEHIRIEDVPIFAPLTAHPEFAERVAKCLAEGRSGTVQNVLLSACKMKPTAACTPFQGFSDILSDHPGVDWNNRYRIVENKKYRAEVEELDHVVIDADHGRHVVCFDVRGVKDAIERTKQRLKDRDTKDKSQVTSSTGYEKSPAEKRATRIQNKERSLQLERMVDHLAKQDDFGEDLVKHAYRQFLTSVGQVASRKVEQLALDAILGEYAPPERKTSWGSTEKPLARGCPELVDQLWDTDRVVLDRYVAAVVHLQAGGYDHHVRDDDVLKFTTGKTGKQLHAAAVAAVDGPKKPAKPKKSGKKTICGTCQQSPGVTKINNMRLHRDRGQRCPGSGCWAMTHSWPARNPEAAAAQKQAKKTDIPKGSKAAKQIHELHTNGAVPKTKPDSEAKTRREAALQRAKELPLGCVWGGCQERFKTEKERDEHVASCQHGNVGRPKCPECSKWITPVKGKVPRHKDNRSGDWCSAIGHDVDADVKPATRPAAAAGKECPECKSVVSKKGRGAEARLECFCTPEGGVPVEVAA